jgi:hypothetical protein
VNARERAIAIATAAIVSTVLLWVVVLSPALESYKASGERVDSLTDALRASQDLLSRKPTLVEQRRALDLALAPPGAPTQAIPEFLDRIKSLSEAAGLRPTTLRYLRAEKYETAFSELRFELRATASLKQLEDFLVRLAADGKYVRVASLSVTPQPNEKDATVTADLSLVALAPPEG